MRFLIFVLFVFISEGLFAQPLCSTQKFSFEEGLPHDIVTGILQDEKGLIWASTWNGLSRYDGYEFTHFGPQPGDGCTMKNSRINKIFYSSTGNIWCINHESKAYLFDVRKKVFIDVLQAIENKMQQHYVVREVFSLSNGISWIVCDNSTNFRVVDATCEVSVYGDYDQKIKGDYVFNVTLDSKGNEWVLTDKGISVIGKNAKKFESDFPFHFISEYKGKIWLGSNDGKLARYNPDNGNLKFVNLPEQVSVINSMHISANGKLAVGSNFGFILVNTSGLDFSVFDLKSGGNKSNDAQLFYQDKAGGFWILTADPGVIYLVPGQKPKHLLSPVAQSPDTESNRFMVFEDETGLVWVAPRGGKFCYYDRNSSELKIAFEQFEDRTVPVVPPVRSYCIDKQSNLWTASGKGLFKLSNYPKNFNLVKVDDGQVEIRGLMEDSKKRIWVCTKNGIVRLFDNNGKSIGYLNGDGKIVSGKVKFGSNIYVLYEDKNGCIWMGAKNDGLYCLTPDKSAVSYKIERYYNIPGNNNSLKGTSVYSIFQDSRGRMWVGTYEGGLNLLDKSPDGKVVFINNDNRLKNYPKDIVQNVRYITEVSNGIVMLGTLDGLISFSVNFEKPENIKFYRNVRNPDNARSLSANDVMYIFEDRKKDVYVVTQNAGVNKLVSDNLLSDNLKFEGFNQNNGLFSNLTRSMVEDGNGFLWLVSKTGLSKWNNTEKNFEYYKVNGLGNLLSYSEASVILSSNKDIWVGTDNGVFFFDPLKFKPDGFVPGIYFTDIKVQGKSISGFDSNKKLILQPNQRNLTIQYAALDFKDSKNIKYSYILEGLDDSWHFEGGNRSASYLNLPDGEYLFKVRSTNSDGVWTDNVTTLLIEVKPKFSETVWIWVVYVLIFIILTGIVVYVILTIFRLRHEVDVEQQMSDIKLRFFTDISHDLRTPLTLISCPVADVLENEPISDKVRDQLTVVQNNTNRLLALVNQILDFRKIQNKKMKLVVEEVEILQVVSKIMNDFSQIAEYKDIDFSVNCPDKGVRLWIDKDKFERILFNLLSNAFKYTENGKSVNISITDFDSVIRIIVKDEGPGIAKDQLETIFERFEMGKGNSQQINSSGLGLSLVKELVNLHHAEIFVDSNMGEGSSFILEFKKGRRHFEEDEQAEVLASDGMSSDFLEAEDEEDSLEKLEKRDVIPLVLVVEDNPEMLLFLKEILSRSYTVMTALNGLEGLKVAAEVLPDLIVTDIMMPHMDGLEMIRKIKDNKNICHIPIIVLSAKASIEDKLQGLEAGIDDYITKPFSSSYLLTRIKYLLNQRRVWQEALLSSSTAFSTQYGETARTTKAELMPSEPQVTSYDDIFIKELMKTLEAQLENSSLNVDMLAADLNMSRTVFYKKVKSLLGITPVDLIRDIRIKRAVQLIEVGGFSLTEVAYMCGFSDSNYFSKCFKKATGVTPSKYKESISPN